EVGRRAVAGQVEGHQVLAGRELHGGDLARRQAGQLDWLAGARVLDPYDRARICVDDCRAVSAAFREHRAHDVPVRFLYVLVPASGEVVPPEAAELAALVGAVVEMPGSGVEGLRHVAGRL